LSDTSRGNLSALIHDLPLFQRLQEFGTDKSTRCFLIIKMLNGVLKREMMRNYNKMLFSKKNLQDDSAFPQALQDIRNHSHPMYFMLVSILMTSVIWTARNGFIFNNNVQSQISSAKETFKKEMRLLTLRAKSRYPSLFDLWTQNLLWLSFALVFSSFLFFVS
jgi:hypothetical protein